MGMRLVNCTAPTDGDRSIHHVEPGLNSLQHSTGQKDYEIRIIPTRDVRIGFNVVNTVEDIENYMYLEGQYEDMSISKSISAKNK
ncbi:uncharacterized protein LAJ45_08387 [Morchella importuna]|uniref:uncharacterized protein n=1 Tax=Morchella importuna TaxID=1174673 RepID=UPI001E8DDCF4|nr:uncharacterized protein LAJ45_08387 [Morchella importuna]KAH8147560.1 hypothetical protein LAJ45_08387 [Morchella importuna]